MIIWLDGVLGVGKTNTALKIKDKLSDDNIEFLDSDFYYLEMIQKNFLSAFGGTKPQTNQNFISYFRKIIEEKASHTDKPILIAMALTARECKEGLLDYFIRSKKNLLHIILTADKEILKERILNDESRPDKRLALDDLESGISFINNNFSDESHIDTTNNDLDTTANEIIKIVGL